MELLVLIVLGALFARPHSSSGSPTVAGGVNLAGALGSGGGPPAVDMAKICTQLGLDATDCRLIQQGNFEQLSEHAVEGLCTLAGLPAPCSTLGDALVRAVFGSPSWAPANKINMALNGERLGDWRNSFIVADGYKGTCTADWCSTSVGGVRVYRSGCIPLKKCATGWAKCKPGTIPMDQWFPSCRCNVVT